MVSRKPMDVAGLGLMILFCSVLGLQQVAIKSIAQDIAPIMQIALRSGLGAALLALYMCSERDSPLFNRDLRKLGLAVGLLFALEYYLLGEALQRTSASHAVVLLYTAPIFAGVLLHALVPSERMARMQWVGILLAFTGVAATFLWRKSDPHNGQPLQGDLLALLAAIAWGATTVFIRTTRLADISAKQLLLYQLMGAFILLLPLALVSGQASVKPTPLIFINLGFQAVIVSFAGFLIWFWLLKHYFASQLGALSFMTPVFGVLFGAGLLGETIEPGFLLGTSFVIAGVCLVTAHEWIKRALFRRGAH